MPFFIATTLAVVDKYATNTRLYNFPPRRWQQCFPPFSNAFALANDSHWHDGLKAQGLSKQSFGLPFFACFYFWFSGWSFLLNLSICRSVPITSFPPEFLRPRLAVNEFFFCSKASFFGLKLSFAYIFSWGHFFIFPISPLHLPPSLTLGNVVRCHTLPSVFLWPVWHMSVAPCSMFLQQRTLSTILCLQRRLNPFLETRQKLCTLSQII